jgi:translation initiation factor IF-1
MSAPDAVTERAVVVAEIGPSAWWVQLDNGHRLVARALRRDQVRLGPVRVGALLRVSVSPGDMSKGLVELETVL